MRQEEEEEKAYKRRQQSSINIVKLVKTNISTIAYSSIQKRPQDIQSSKHTQQAKEEEGTKKRCIGKGKVNRRRRKDIT